MHIVVWPLMNCVWVDINFSNNFSVTFHKKTCFINQIINKNVVGKQQSSLTQQVHSKTHLSLVNLDPEFIK